MSFDFPSPSFLALGRIDRGALLGSLFWVAGFWRPNRVNYLSFAMATTRLNHGLMCLRRLRWQIERLSIPDAQ